MKSLNTILKKSKGKTLMVIFPHPDDESMASGGLLLVAKKYGLKTVVLTLTHGDKGKVYIPKNGRTTSEIREEELRKSISVLKVDTLILEKFPDGKLKNTIKMWNPIVKKHIHIQKPDIVVTYDHSGITGHPDHIVLSVEIKSLLNEMFINKNAPSLFWMTAKGKFKKKIVNHKVISYLSTPTHKLSLTPLERIRKIYASYVHKSQRVIKPSVVLYFLFFGPNEWYHKVDINKDYKYKFVQFDI